MTTDEWIRLYTAFEELETLAKNAGFATDVLKAIGDELFITCPVPQPLTTLQKHCQRSENNQSPRP